MNRSPEDTSSPASAPRDTIPRGLQVGAAYTWRVLVIGLGIAAVVLLAIWLSEIVVPFLIGLLLSALLVPLSSFLQRHHWPKWVAIITAWVVVFAVLTGLVLVVIQQVRDQLPSIEKQVLSSLNSAEALLASHPLGIGISSADVNHYVSEGTAWLQKHASEIGAGAAEAGSSVAHLLEGIFIVIFVTLFALIDGRRIWAWTVSLFPTAAQGRITVAGAAGWHTLTNFIRIQLVVAATDGLFIGIGATILGVPLAVPIAVVVFFGAFVPVVGAIVGGVVAVGLALVFNGWVSALIMLAIVVGVQQIESHVLHPLLTGSAVKVHPLGVVLGVVTGAAVAGVIGAFFAVPFIATVNSMVVAARRWTPETEAVPVTSGPTPDEVDDAVEDGGETLQKNAESARSAGSGRSGRDGE
ncbi:AI-2E family transporter [Brachybacterium endophyticum]|uniref:AI-2E family transporter n=1 Tax=Brachybacterium endophyticum TaxID=2182385 RepID=A0A2U2RKR8_9MICO|nr:AI-2E family transporter [Brachybacterium endophyticum]PWH06463.1 AI-2E family transporter [Brachybacterium endophyticum]